MNLTSVQRQRLVESWSNSVKLYC